MRNAVWGRCWCNFLQIAGGYRGSYFSMIGWPIPKSPNGHDVSAALSPKLVSLYDFLSGLLLGAAAAAALSPKLAPLRDFTSGLLLAAAAALSPKLVSLHDFPSGLLLAVAAALVSQACLPS